jgi:uncharacterized membrane protein
VTGGARRAFRTITHALFDLGVVLKAIGGAAQLAGALAVVLVPPERLGRIAERLAHTGFSSASRSFVVAYLAVHGVVKIGLAWALLHEKLWAYPTAMIVFTAFGAWQVDRWLSTRSGWLLALTVLDAFVIWLTWLEWGRHRTRLGDLKA